VNLLRMSFFKTFNAKSLSKGAATSMDNISSGFGHSMDNIFQGIEPAFKDMTSEASSLMSSPFMLIGLGGLALVVMFGMSRASDTANKGIETVGNNPELAALAMQMA
jgi:hypothetical protein